MSIDGHRALNDAEGIIAFVLRRDFKLHDWQIARAIGCSGYAVTQFFDSYYRRPWPRALQVPKGWTPEVIAEKAAKLAGCE